MRSPSVRLQPSPVATLVLPAVASLAALLSCTMDPVNAAQESAFAAAEDLGPKENSEFHRPGQDCLACHGPRGNAKPKFSIAGTVFWGTCIDPDAPPDTCIRKTVDNAEVRIVDGENFSRCIRTNCAGNFFIEEGKWASGAPNKKPLFPLLSSVRKVTQEGAAVEQVMSGHIGRSGSCNDCHRTSPFWNSAGQIYLYGKPDQVPASATSEYESCMQNPVAPTEGECLQQVPR